jgi:hypothetical protein
VLNFSPSLTHRDIVDCQFVLIHLLWNQKCSSSTSSLLRMLTIRPCPESHCLITALDVINLNMHFIIILPFIHWRTKWSLSLCFFKNYFGLCTLFPFSQPGNTCFSLHNLPHFPVNIYNTSTSDPHTYRFYKLKTE